MELQTNLLFSWLFGASCLLVSSLHSAQAAYFYTAFVNISYVDSQNITVWQKKESGLYGQDSPKASASGVVLLAEPIHGCEINTFYNAPSNGREWIALIQRGHGCTFSDKIRNAANNGAIAAVIFNEADTNSVIQMAHPGTGGTVAIMIGHDWGVEIVNLIKSGVQVELKITLGNPHGPWMSQYSLILVSLSFFVVTAVTVGYFIFHSARRLHRARAMNRREKQLKNEAKKAIGKLQVRILKQDDPETGPEADTCAVCIEAYKAGDEVSILTCSHFFHKVCVEPWLLEHRTCPMCKCDILKSLGIEPEAEGPEDHPYGPQVAVLPEVRTHPTILTVTEGHTCPTTLPVTEDDARSDTASSGYASVQESEDRSTPSSTRTLPRHAPQQNQQSQPSYDNLAFEGDSHDQQNQQNLYESVGDSESPLEAKS
ncbi:hypothetical protein JZ751_016917 [Albula glossodonta]|uniref:RING-type domain-containing protein n=1 Tax=Albula glossodonta TaxID=121402 RepID=A0A8T2MI65_9TELE|nr:hypothetical protein JZ751_016917 [Albula glossodonta]